MKRIVKVIVAAGLFFSLFSSIASAHVTVNPNTSAPGAWETYTVKVPAEKELPTTKLILKIPSGVEFEQYQPVPGWNFSAQKDANGKATTITFEATGGGILPGQFQQFVFVAKNPDQSGKIAWDAFQYYKDGSIVEWTGDESSKTPHSITNIVKATAMPGMTMEQPKTQKTSPAANTANANANALPLILSIVSILLSLIALILAVRKNK